MITNPSVLVDKANALSAQAEALTSDAVTLRQAATDLQAQEAALMQATARVEELRVSLAAAESALGFETVQHTATRQVLTEAQQMVLLQMAEVERMRGEVTQREAQIVLLTAEVARLQALVDAGGPVDPPPPPAPTYRLTTSAATVEEGAEITCMLHTTDVPEGTAVGYSISGVSPSDLESGEMGGAFVIGADGTAVQTLRISADLVTEGQEVLLLTLENDLAAASVVIQDTSTTPVPPPPPDPSGLVWEPRITGEPQVAQYDINDTGSGASYRFLSSHLCLEWKNLNVGDWVDAEGVLQGSAPFAGVPTPAPNVYVETDVTVLARVLVENGNQGIRLRAGGVGGVVICAGRTTATPPALIVTTPDGEVSCRPLSNMQWTSEKTGTLPVNSTAKFQVDGGTFHAALRFDMTGITEVISAKLRIFVMARYGSGTTLQAFALRGQSFVLGAGSGTPVPGLAAEVGEAGLVGHPDVYMAGDFAGTTFDAVKRVAFVPKLFGPVNVMTPAEIVPDPDAPGTMAWRGSFVAVTTATDPKRQAFDGTKALMGPDFNDPLRPPKDPVKSAWARMYITLEDDYGHALDGHKIAITWDLRLGWWNEFSKSWQNLTGNGGARGDGRMHRQVIGGVERATYWGHMERMEFGQAPVAPFIYGQLRPVLGYNYHLYQAGPFPGGASDPNGGAIYSNVVTTKIQKGVPICIEQYLQMNDVDLTNVDALGNGEAIKNGILQTEINGIVVDRREDFAWTRHPLGGIGGFNCNAYLGGRVAFPGPPMHFRMNHIVLAKRRIGPRVAPSSQGA